VRTLRACDHEGVDGARAVADDVELVGCPPGGRQIVRRRSVRLGDVTASGRLRLDALARYLQDVAADDVDDAGIVGAWVLRRAVLRIGELPGFRDALELTTFCSGTGGRVAERRTTVRSGGAVRVETAAIWVYVDESGRPARLEDWFFDLYGRAANGRTVKGRLRHPPPPADATRRPWPLRQTDVDVLAHVNNAIAWAAVEDVLAGMPAHRIVRAEVEYRAPIDRDDPVELVTTSEPGSTTCWLTVAGEVRTSAVVGLEPVDAVQ
jgi:acyl-ACP thioesterase